MDIRVLGPVQLLGHGGAVPVGGRRARAILADLVVHRRRTVAAAALADAVWDGDPPKTYAVSVQVSVSNLRKTMRAAGIDAESILRTVAPGYLLDITEDQCDVGRFERARALGAKAGSASAAAAHFRAALGEWQGEALADLRELSFANEYAAALDEARWAAMSGRIEADIACGRASLMIGELHSLVTDHPLREPLWGQLITALYLSGRQADALEACRRVRAILAEELGVDPDRQLADLERKILRHEVIGREVEPADPRLAMTTTIAEAPPPTGRWRLRMADGRVLDMPPDVLRIGRMADNELALDDPKVSRYHAALSRTGSAVVLRDLDSTNGVYVDGTRISDLTALREGMEIRIGSCTMTVEAVPE